jgi:hypothetical protein
MTKSWESRGTVWLDGKHYWIQDLLDSDRFEDGRVVSLALVEVDPEPKDDEWGYDDWEMNEGAE